MKISTTLTLAGIAIFNAPGAVASCYGSGNIWLDRGEAQEWVRFACKGNGGMFTGWFAPGQTKKMCPASKWGGQTAGFEVQNLNNNQGFDLGDQDCFDRLWSEISNCLYGGTSTVAGWRFK